MRRLCINLCSYPTDTQVSPQHVLATCAPEFERVEVYTYATQPKARVLSLNTIHNNGPSSPRSPKDQLGGRVWDNKGEGRNSPVAGTGAQWGMPIHRSKYGDPTPESNRGHSTQQRDVLLAQGGRRAGWWISKRSPLRCCSV